MEWNPAVSEAQYFAGLTPAEVREFPLIRFPWEVEPDDTKTESLFFFVYFRFARATALTARETPPA